MKKLYFTLFLSVCNLTISAQISFSDIADPAGIGETGFNYGASIIDYDRDGWEDIYIARRQGPNRLFCNQGDETFVDVTLSSGATDTLSAMGALFFDYDNDRDLDMYLVHDANHPNILYQNDGTGHFVDVSVAAGVNYAGFGMGVDAGDINNDGFQDIYLNNTPSAPNVLYRNKGDNTFEKIGENTSLASTGNSYGLACGDLNKDGRVDLLVANSFDNKGNQLIKNFTSNSFHWFAVQVEGTQTNRNGIGARVEVKTNGQWQTDVVSGGPGWSSQNSLIQHFGVGMATTVDSLVLKWPGGTTDYYENLPVDQVYQVSENAAPTAWVDDLDVRMNLKVWPNPFSDRFYLSFELPEPGSMEFSMTGLQGRKIPEKKTGMLGAGEHKMEFGPVELPSGLYFGRLKTSRGTLVMKLIK